MKILSANPKKNEYKLQVDDLDDLWSLSYLIEPGDIISARTFRKIKLGGDTDRDSSVVKKPMFLSISVTKVEFHKYSSALRASGTIVSGPEDIPHGSHHTMNIEDGTIFELSKPQMLKYQRDKLREATEEKPPKVLLLTHDREEAAFAVMKKYGYEMLAQVSGDVTKKDEQMAKTADFYDELLKILTDYDTKYSFENIIIASPGFWKEYLMKKLPPQLSKKCVPATVSAVGPNGMNELLKRPEVKAVLDKQRAAGEMNMVEELLRRIGKEEPAAYGLADTKDAVAAGAVSDLLVTDGLIMAKRQEEKFHEIEVLMRKVDQMDGSVHIISSEHDGGTRLDGLGGIAAILRYRIR